MLTRNEQQRNDDRGRQTEKLIKWIICKSLMNLSMTQAVNSSLTRMNSGVRISLLNHRREMLKKKRFFFKPRGGGHVIDCGAWHPVVWEVTRWYACPLSPTSILHTSRLTATPQPSNTIHLPAQAAPLLPGRAGNTTHTHTNRHTPCVQLECKKFSLCIHEGCLCLSPLLSFLQTDNHGFL